MCTPREKSGFYVHMWVSMVKKIVHIAQLRIFKTIKLTGPTCSSLQRVLSEQNYAQYYTMVRLRWQCYSHIIDLLTETGYSYGDFFWSWSHWCCSIPKQGVDLSILIILSDKWVCFVMSLISYYISLRSLILFFCFNFYFIPFLVVVTNWAQTISTFKCTASCFVFNLCTTAVMPLSWKS